jgi:hypothetical protein
MAQRISRSKEWKALLVDVRDRIRFEYGFIEGVSYAVGIWMEITRYESTALIDALLKEMKHGKKSAAERRQR